jgi:hypothetical protein
MGGVRYVKEVVDRRSDLEQPGRGLPIIMTGQNTSGFDSRPPRLEVGHHARVLVVSVDEAKIDTLRLKKAGRIDGRGEYRRENVIQFAAQDILMEDAR